MSDDNTTLTIRLPGEMRDAIKRHAEAEHRTESQFVRFHLSAVLDALKPATSAKRKAKPANR